MRRETACQRNLDDPLKLFGIITVRSSGLVLMVFGVAHFIEMTTGLWSRLFGAWSVLLGELGLAAVFGMLLAWTERYEDEHYVPSMLRYYASGRWRFIHAGGRPAAGLTVKELYAGR
jgi:hypothetical protein